jgi:hypothetical protein
MNSEVFYENSLPTSSDMESDSLEVRSESVDDNKSS